MAWGGDRGPDWGWGSWLLPVALLSSVTWWGDLLATLTSLGSPLRRGGVLFREPIQSPYTQTGCGRSRTDRCSALGAGAGGGGEVRSWWWVLPLLQSAGWSWLCPFFRGAWTGPRGRGRDSTGARSAPPAPQPSYLRTVQRPAGRAACVSGCAPVILLPQETPVAAAVTGPRAAPHHGRPPGAARPPSLPTLPLDFALQTARERQGVGGFAPRAQRPAGAPRAKDTPWLVGARGPGGSLSAAAGTAAARAVTAPGAERCPSPRRECRSG